MRGPTCSFEKYAAIVAVSASWSLQVHQREWAERVCGRQTTWSHQRGLLPPGFASDLHPIIVDLQENSGNVQDKKYIKIRFCFGIPNPHSYLFLAWSLQKILTDEPFFGNDGIRKSSLNIGVIGCFLLKHTMLTLRLIQTLTGTLDFASDWSLGVDHNAFRQIFHHIPYRQWYMLFQFSHHIDEDCFIFCCWLDCNDTVRVYHERFLWLAGAWRLHWPGLERHLTKTIRSLHRKWINPSKSLAKASEVSDFRISDLCICFVMGSV